MSTDTRAGARRGEYAKTAEIRDRILIAAVELFAESGFHGTTLKAVAARAGLSERGIAHHYSGKEALLLGVLDRHEALRARQVGSRVSLETVAELLQVVSQDASLPTLVELHCVMSAEATAGEHPAHERYRDRYAELRSFLAGVFDRLRDEGRLVSDLAPSAIAAGLLALMDGLQLQWVYDRDAVQVVPTIDGYLRGILTTSAMDELLALRT